MRDIIFFLLLYFYDYSLILLLKLMTRYQIKLHVILYSMYKNEKKRIENKIWFLLKKVHVIRDMLFFRCKNNAILLATSATS